MCALVSLCRRDSRQERLSSWLQMGFMTPWDTLLSTALKLCRCWKDLSWTFHSQLPFSTMEYWNITVAIFPSRQVIFPSEILKLQYLKMASRIITKIWVLHWSFSCFLIIQASTATVIFQYSIVRLLRMTVLWPKSGYMMTYCLSHPEIPAALPQDFPQA